MLNISGLDNGIVLDHIPAGMSMEIYKYLNLGKLDSQERSRSHSTGSSVIHLSSCWNSSV